jgi:hypothetical protein
MKLQHVIALGLGLAVLFVPEAVSAHTRAGDQSTIAQSFHHLFHAAQQPGVITAFSTALVAVLLLYVWKRGDRS